MFGGRNVVDASCNNDDSFPEFTLYPSGIRLEILCPEVLPVKCVLGTVTNIVNSHQTSAAATWAFETTFGGRRTRVPRCSMH